MRTTRGSGGRASDGQEQERFARAVDSGMREVSDDMLNRELTVVAALRQVGSQFESTAGPDPAERDRMRQRVMAEFSSVVHDGTSPVLPLSSSGWNSGSASRKASRNRRWIPDETRGRLVVAAAAALCLLMSLSGMSVLLSRDALPGDALYTFKRSAESAELGLTFGDQPKALKHLEFASARVSEIEMMAEQADAAGNWSDGHERFRQALDDFDADTAAGARLLTALAAHGQTNILTPLRSWAQQQETRLRAVRTALPLPASARLDSTLGLLDRVVVRTSALDYRSECATVTSGTHDDLGLLPAKDTCSPIPVDGTSSAVPLPAAPAPDGSSPNVIMPPGLLGSPSVNPTPEPVQKDERGRPGLRDVLRPEAGQPGPESARPLPGRDSQSPDIPLPLPGIPLPVFPEPPS
ncbi:MAG: DUF5667 domain-containing protein [Actinomycetota bacterium]|nr:DUF5667 domain-containing protein [Actinomycetota bacterium]